MSARLREVYAFLRRMAAVLYSVMGLWLLIAGGRRITLQVTGQAPQDFAGWTSASLGAAALLVLVVGLVIRRRITVQAGR